MAQYYIRRVSSSEMHSLPLLRKTAGHSDLQNKVHLFSQALCKKNKLKMAGSLDN